MKNIFFRGFSLIEMLVAVSVVLVLTGVGLTNFSSLSKNKNLMSARDELVSWLSDAKNLAITNQLPDKSLGLKFVKVTVNNSGLTAVGVDNSNNSQTFFSKKFTNADDLVIENSANSDFGFNKITGRLTDQSGNLIDGPITITLKNGSSVAVIINDLGVINEK